MMQSDTAGASIALQFSRGQPSPDPHPPTAWPQVFGAMTPEAFGARYWGKTRLQIKGGGPRHFDGLISLAELERYFGSQALFERGLLTMPEQGFGPPLPPPASASELYRRLCAGGSLRIRRLECLLDPGSPAVRLAQDVQRALQHPLESLSCYVSPAGAVGLGPHHDDSEIFTLQISGRKRWRIYHRAGGPSAIHRAETLGAPEAEIDLGAGDLLYTPSGLIHDVVCEEPSLSLTLVFAPFRWSSLLDLAISRLGNAAEFRQALPAGALLGLGEPDALAAAFPEKLRALQAAIAALTPQDLADQLAGQLLATVAAPPGDQLATALDLASLGAESWVRRRDGLSWRLSEHPDSVRLTVGGGYALRAHPSAAPALRALMTRETSFRVGALHESLAVDAAVALARELIIGGVLSICDPGDDEDRFARTVC